MGRFRGGDKIGKYTIASALGEGGFGESYLAKDERLGRFVVIKCLREDLPTRFPGADDLLKDIRARFRVEACAQARIDHRNVCKIIDFDEENQLIVMEYIEGETLEQRRTKSPRLSRKELIGIFIAVAEGVAEAHRKNVLHRDLTLNNIMVTKSNQVKVLDFGLARLTDEPRFTAHSTVLGTGSYMSPEQQIESGRANERSDIFSFGVSIYRLITRYFPYPDIFTAEPDPDQPLPFTSFGLEPWPDLNHVVMEALQLDPRDRFASMENMLAKLVEVRQSLLGVNRTLYFFDTSTLLEVVCPPVPTEDGRRLAKRAQDQFEAHHLDDSAVSSAGVIEELLDRVAGLYFDSRFKGATDDTQIRNVAEEGESPWKQIGWGDKIQFLSGAKSLFLGKLLTLASQLVLTEMNNHILLSKWIEFTVDMQFSGRDARILAEACSIRAAFVFSEEARYRGMPHRRVLESIAPNLFRLLGATAGGNSGKLDGPGVSIDRGSQANTALM